MLHIYIQSSWVHVKKVNQPRLLGSVERQMDNGICEVAAAVEPLKPLIFHKVGPTYA